MSTTEPAPDDVPTPAEENDDQEHRTRRGEPDPQSPQQDPTPDDDEGGD